ncbi:extensin family protein [Thalassococcus sp. CAU 1522]|uniref:Extensin family protein n=2 Tax=Thalassococcus arenae TaxID=2851652 RepID=A0ABS6N6H7_9RHOB|nr:extensin family protein [Thalassococcus arenae]MBV2359267.1 extensin family protein [Thalassococcus arenae]
MVVLASCSARETPPAETDNLSGIRGFLNNAFASTASEEPRSFAGGGLCGDPVLIGEPIGTVDGKGACGIDGAVRLRAVGSVALSQPATINCETAKALRQWIDTGAKPAVASRGVQISSLKVAAHYACRTRNHQRGARISEHGKGRAIDISAIRLTDGSEITVLNGWNSKRHGQILRDMHQSACGPFGTVLGPNSDRFHRDHFHFDTAQYRSGSYCR